MRRIFFATVLALLLSLQNFCDAATIESATFNGNETLVYPIVLTGDATVDAKINGAIVDELNRFIKECHYAAQYDGIEFAGMNTNFDVPCNRAGNTVILSVVLTESTYVKGAAHPSTRRHALNFNAESGDLMDWTYLTDIGAGNPKFSLENVTQKLQAYAEREGLRLFDEALPLKALPENFYWDENLHVHLIFQQYDVAPYAVGIIDLDMDA